MRYAVLGTGSVGRTSPPGCRPRPRGHHRHPRPKATLARTSPTAWATRRTRPGPPTTQEVSLATFADAAAGGELVVNATSGGGSLPALDAAGAEQPGRQGPARHRQPARLLARLPAQPVRQGHRLPRRADPAGLPGGQGRQDAQHDDRRADGRPGASPGDHTVFVSGNDARPRRRVTELLESSAGHRRHRPRRHHDRARHRDAAADLAAALGRARSRRLQLPHPGSLSPGRTRTRASSSHPLIPSRATACSCPRPRPRS